MRKPFLHCLLTLNLLMVFSSGMVFAQAPDEEIDLMVAETLDQMEKDIHRTQAPAGGKIIEYGPKDENDIPSGPSLTDTPLEIKTTSPTGIEISGEIVVVPDEDRAEGLEMKIIPLEYAEAAGIIAALEEMKSPEGEVTYAAAEGTLFLKDTPEKVAAMSAYVKKVDILLETAIFRPEYIDIADILEQIRKALTEGIGEARADEPTDSIIVTDTPAVVGKIRELVKEMDRFNKKISIETKVIEIVLNEQHALGVDWEAIVSNYQNVDFQGYSVPPEQAGSGRLSLGVVTQEDYAVLLEALDTVGAIHTISEEIVTAEHKQSERVKILSVAQRRKGDGEADGGTVSFDVIPSVNKGGTQTVSIRPQLMAGNPGPPPDEKNSSVDVQVENGDTIVIGSLFEEVLVESSWKIPLLGDLPLLGFVFRNEGEVPRRAEIITFLTMKVVEENKN